MTKAQLVELASSLDIEVSSSWTKAVIIDTILENL